MNQKVGLLFKSYLLTKINMLIPKRVKKHFMQKVSKCHEIVVTEDGDIDVDADPLSTKLLQIENQNKRAT